MLFIGEKRISLSLFLYPVFSLIYLFIYLPELYRLFLPAHPYTYFSCFSVFPLYTYILFHSLRRDIVLSLANSCMSISWPVCREFDGKRKSSKKRCNVENTKQFASTFRNIFIELINVISRDKSDSFFHTIIHTLRHTYPTIYFIIKHFFIIGRKN